MSEVEVLTGDGHIDGDGHFDVVGEVCVVDTWVMPTAEYFFGLAGSSRIGGHDES